MRESKPPRSTGRFSQDPDDEGEQCRIDVVVDEYSATDPACPAFRSSGSIRGARLAKLQVRTVRAGGNGT